MGKIICELCGTAYSDTLDACPICGYSRDPGMEPQQDQPQDNFDYNTGDYAGADGTYDPRMNTQEPPAYDGPVAPPEHGMFDFDASNPDPDPAEMGSDRDFMDIIDAEVAPPRDGYASFEDLGDEEDTGSYGMPPMGGPYGEPEKPKKQSVGLVIGLVILNVLLLSGSIFLFFKFLLPGKLADRVPPTTAAYETEAPTTEATTLPAIPCTSLALTSHGSVELYQEGQFWLIHVTALPEDTTDKILYFSEDENVATVTETGRVTAVGEGSTNIIVTCGLQQLSCPVTVVYKEVLDPPATKAAEEATVPAETEAATEAPEETEAEAAAETEAQEETEAPEETEIPQEAEEEKELRTDVELKLKKSDILFKGKGLSTQLELDCDLEPEDVEWSSTDTGIVQVDESGNVKVVGYGAATVKAKYGDQEVECVVRCTQK